jgi:hypothetical protein
MNQRGGRCGRALASSLRPSSPSSGAWKRSVEVLPGRANLWSCDMLPSTCVGQHGPSLRLSDALVVAGATVLGADRIITTDARWPTLAVRIEVLREHALRLGRDQVRSCAGWSATTNSSTPSEGQRRTMSSTHSPIVRRRAPSGMDPVRRIWSWNARMSNRSPSRAAASARIWSIVIRPSM